MLHSSNKMKISLILLVVVVITLLPLVFSKYNEGELLVITIIM